MHNKNKVLTEFPSEINLGDSHIPNSDVVSQFHSEDLGRHGSVLDSERLQNLYLLIIKFRLEQLGFRRNQYTSHIEKISSTKLTFPQVQGLVNQICQTIISNRVEKSAVNEVRIRPKSRSIMKSESVMSIRPEQLQQSLFVCPVCCDEIFVQGLSVGMPCRHSFCDNCLINHIDQCFQQAKFDIGCLELTCTAQLPDAIIEKALTPERYERFRHFKRKRMMEANPNNKYCSKPNCEGILKEDENDDAPDVCPICLVLYCRLCNRPSHQGSCQGQLQQAIETVYDRLKIKKCPKCRSPIEKSQGCNHMTCKKCSFEFCWICLRPYSKFHYRYYNCCGCPGMQFEDESDVARQRCKQVLFFLILPVILLGLLAIVLICLPLYMVVMIFIKPYQKSVEKAPTGGCCCQQCCEDCCGDCCECQKCGICCLLLFFAYLPYGIIYGVFVAPIKFIAMIYSETLEVLD